jgi:hypothetical protein
MFTTARASLMTSMIALGSPPIALLVSFAISFSFNRIWVILLPFSFSFVLHINENIGIERG